MAAAMTPTYTAACDVWQYHATRSDCFRSLLTANPPTSERPLPAEVARAVVEDGFTDIPDADLATVYDAGDLELVAGCMFGPGVALPAALHCRHVYPVAALSAALRELARIADVPVAEILVHATVSEGDGARVGKLRIEYGTCTAVIAAMYNDQTSPEANAWRELAG